MGQTTSLKRINFETGIFEANGRTYTVEQSLSISRYAEFQILEKELAYGVTAESMAQKFRTLYDNINKRRDADNAVILNDLLRGVTKLQERKPIVLKICTLFINFEDEDRTTINADAMDVKINDWQKEGIDIRDFFSVAVNSVNGLLQLYENLSRHTFQTEESHSPNEPGKQ